MKIKPLQLGIIVKSNDINGYTQSDAGLYIKSDEKRGLSRQGEVTAIGKDVEEVEIGDTIIFKTQYASLITQEDNISVYGITIDAVIGVIL